VGTILSSCLLEFKYAHGQRGGTSYVLSRKLSLNLNGHETRNTCVLY